MFVWGFVCFITHQLTGLEQVMKELSKYTLLSLRLVMCDLRSVIFWIKRNYVYFLTNLLHVSVITSLFFVADK